MVLAKQRIAEKNPLKTNEALGQSEKFLEFQELLARVAPINRPVLLLGERGTGKELAASRLHYLSKRWQGPFVALNCSALNPTLIESELFGYEKGAFTGASQRRTGRFEAADGGTLFLDEIGTIPMEVQEKILRVVEYGTFERVGDSTVIEVDVRIIAATNADLVHMVSQGRFKRDLLDRLSFEVLFLPPLKERKEDIMLLTNHFASRMAFELGRKDIPRFTEEAMNALENYDWPGNVRELKNLVERAVYRSETDEISDINFDPFSSPYVLEKNIPRKNVEEHVTKAPVFDDLFDKTLPDAVNELQVRLLNNALKSAKHNQKIAAKRLGITYHQFRGLYRKLHNNID
ncbi:MAG: phage shock protein operon transcriptional activator [Deltaproteobacteria bacterium]|nr:phage shock protein operon transcriptional activator [Deltaproteobacteria bacterium]